MQPPFLRVKQETEQKPQTNGRLYTTVAAGGEQKLTWHGLIDKYPVQLRHHQSNAFNTQRDRRRWHGKVAVGRGEGRPNEIDQK
jgi:hypothetical protein